MNKLYIYLLVDLAVWVKEKYGWDLEVVLRPKESSKKFRVTSKKPIVLNDG